MSAKSGLNPDLLFGAETGSESSHTSTNDLLQANIDMVAHDIHTYYKNNTQTDTHQQKPIGGAVNSHKRNSPKMTENKNRNHILDVQTMTSTTGVSPSALRRSLTMHYDENCDHLSNKSSTLPHDFNRCF